MIKKIKCKDVELQIKTNMLKLNECYFGDKDIMGEFEKAIRVANYKKSKESTTESFLLLIYKSLTDSHIKPYKLSYKDVIYMGARMTDINSQTTIKKE